MGNKIINTIIISVIVVLILFYVLNNYIYKEKQGDSGFQKGYKDITYVIEGVPTTLINGLSEVEIMEGSASQNITKYFGNEAEGDLNGDGISDIAFLLTQESGGSGTFYYVVAAIKNESGYKGTNAVFLGDRISPQTTEIKNEEIIVNYADRKQGEEMTIAPSVGVSKYLKVFDFNLIEVKK